MQTKKAISFLEVLIVVIIIAIIVAFAMPGYFGAKSRALDREAQSQLKLIQSAQKIYRLEVGFYTPCDDNADCNNVLSIDLPADTGGGGNWDYAVSNIVSDPPAFVATASGSGGTQGQWTIDQDDEQAQ